MSELEELRSVVDTLEPQREASHPIQSKTIRRSHITRPGHQDSSWWQINSFITNRITTQGTAASTASCK